MIFVSLYQILVGNGSVLEWALGLIDYTRSPKWRFIAFNHCRRMADGLSSLQNPYNDTKLVKIG